MNSLHKSGMYQSLVVVLLLALVRGGSAFPFGNEESEANIQKGRKAYHGEFKYQVALMLQPSQRYPPFHFCGGSIISKTHVLSAAHCTTGDIGEIPITKENVIIRAGVIDYTCKRHAQDRHVRSWVRHPRGDIVLITVWNPFNFNPFVQPIELPTEIPERSGTECVISGWGGHGTGTESDQFLKRAVNTISSHYEGPIIKLDTPELTTGWVCQGDSGGPLACNGKLVGVIQFFTYYERDHQKVRRDPTFCSDLSSGFGNVFYYIPWLKQNGFVTY